MTSEFSTVMTDLRLASKRKGLRVLLRDLLVHAGTQAIALFRLSHWFHLRGHETLALVVARLNLLLCNRSLRLNPAQHPVLLIRTRN